MVTINEVLPANPARKGQVSANTALYKATAAILVAQFVVFMVTFGVLGNTINWPASLQDPASKVLPLIKEQSGAVALGYFCYMLSALLLIPASLMLRRLLSQRDTTLVTIMATFGVIAGVLKIFGIARWLVLMPSLADTYLDPTASAATRDTVVVVYNAFNKYAGGIGESFGVMLFSGLWTLLVAIALIRSRQLPKWPGYFGLVAAMALLIGFLSLFGVSLGPVLIISGIIWQLWLVTMAVVLFRQHN